MHVFVKDNTDNGGLGLVYHQIIKFVFALVEAPALYEIISIRSVAALEETILDELS